MNETELLFTEILDCDRLCLYLDRDIKLEKDQTRRLAGVLKRRCAGEPIEYILGKTEFMGLEFKITPDVLIPRPETEILVETVIKKSTEYRVQSTEISILDIGSGSGCIAVSLAKLLSNAKVTATDISQEALRIAQDNACLHNVDKKIKFINTDLFPQYSVLSTQYHIIVSNPPYVRSSEIETLQSEVRNEPRIALDGGPGGLDFYRRIITRAPEFLKLGGLLIMEMGFDQRQAIETILKEQEYLEVTEIIKDYAGIDRVIVCRKIPNSNYRMTKTYLFETLEL